MMMMMSDLSDGRDEEDAATLPTTSGKLSCSPGTRCDSPDLAAEPVNYGNKCTARLAQLCNSSKFSDVILNVGGQRYFAHKLLLANASDVFEQMLTSEHWQDACQREIQLLESDDCQPIFGDFLRYIYCGQIMLTTQSVLGLLVLADKYNIPDLKECCSSYMSSHLVSMPVNNKAVTWYQYAIACNSHDLQNACSTYITLNLDVVCHSPDWVYLDRENLIMLLQRSDIVIENEYVLLQAITRWLSEESRVHHLRDNLRDILPFIRFPMILPEHLAEFENSDFQRANHDLFAPYLLSAYRYHALSIRGRRDKEGVDDVPKRQFMYRNYTDENYSIHVDVVRKSFRTCPRVSSKVEKPLSLPVTITNSVPEEMCKMKVTFYPLGYYTTSHWNGQLNLAKATEQTKMVIAHRGGVELEEAEISVIIYAQNGGVRYASHQINVSHTFETYGMVEINNTVDVLTMRAENSPYVIDGGIYLKVFVRPVSFQFELPRTFPSYSVHSGIP